MVESFLHFLHNLCEHFVIMYHNSQIDLYFLMFVALIPWCVMMPADADVKGDLPAEEVEESGNPTLIHMLAGAIYPGY